MPHSIFDPGMMFLEPVCVRRLVANGSWRTDAERVSFSMQRRVLGRGGFMERQVYAGADRRWSASARRRLPVGSRGHGGHPRTLVRPLCRSLGLGGWLRRG